MGRRYISSAPGFISETTEHILMKFGIGVSQI